MSTIRLTFEGLLVIFVNDGRSSCEVALLKDAPGHRPHLQITKIPDGSAPETLVHLHDHELQSQMWLDVRKASPRIEVMRDPSSSDPFQRVLSGTNYSDFRWAVDLEGHEIFKGRISVNPAGFRSTLRINDGKFYAQERSENELTTKEGNASNRVTIGKVAVKLRTVITLAGAELAYFWNGVEASEPLAKFENQAGLDYGIYLAQTRHEHVTEQSEDIDAKYYYNAVAGNIAPSRRISFGRCPEVEPRVTPDAACFPAWMSQSELSLL